VIARDVDQKRTSIIFIDF